MNIPTQNINSVPFFKVIIDHRLKDIVSEYKGADNKYLLNIVNTFQSGKWREKEFSSFIFDNLKETALSASEREALIGNDCTRLEQACKNLKTSDELNRGGEIAEIILYGILKKYYGALPVIPKIFYKQNVEDYAKGADSVHIVIESENKFSYWLGEAKFYNSIETGRFNDLIKSVLEMLSDKKIRKENSIVTSLDDLRLVLENDDLYQKINEQLSDGISLDEIKQILHIPIFILHECKKTKNCTAYTNEYEEELRQQYAEAAKLFFNKQDKKLSDVFFVDKITFHLMFFPVPEKESLVKKYYEKATHYRG